MIRLGIIGCGNMGGAILRQWLKAGMFLPEEVIAADKNAELREKLQSELGVYVTDDNRQAAEAPLLVLAVKPQYAPAVGQEIAGAVRQDGLVLSIMAGYDLKMLHALLKNDQAHIIRVMPNTPAMVGEGMTAACANGAVTREELDYAVRICSGFGKAEIVPESLFDVVTAVSGSSPASVFMFIEAMADAAVQGGMPRAQAYTFAAQAVLGSAKMVLDTGKHPGELKDMVCSPAGTTIEAVRVLEEKGFRSAVFECVKACTEKSAEMRRSK